MNVPMWLYQVQVPDGWITDSMIHSLDHPEYCTCARKRPMQSVIPLSRTRTWYNHIGKTQRRAPSERVSTSTDVGVTGHLIKDTSSLIRRFFTRMILDCDWLFSVIIINICSSVAIRVSRSDNGAVEDVLGLTLIGDIRTQRTKRAPIFIFNPNLVNYDVALWHDSFFHWAN
jgi:hypothetical protein